MKISKYLGTFALLAMLAACSTEDEQVRFAGDEVKVKQPLVARAFLPEVIPLAVQKNRVNFKILTKLELA